MVAVFFYCRFYCSNSISSFNHFTNVGRSQLVKYAGSGNFGQPDNPLHSCLLNNSQFRCRKGWQPLDLRLKMLFIDESGVLGPLKMLLLLFQELHHEDSGAVTHFFKQLDKLWHFAPNFKNFSPVLLTPFLSK